MALNVGTAYLSIRPDMRGFGSELSAGASTESEKAGHAAGEKFTGGFSEHLKGIAAGIGAVFAVDKGLDFLKDSVASANALTKVQNLTAAAIKSTGDASGLSSKQIAEMAEKQADLTGVTDDVAQATDNVLLRFTNVKAKGGVFEEAATAASDLGTKLGSPIAGATVLGKALNNPVKGMAALSRAGITFTAGQQKQIKAFQKSGDLLGAQKVILGQVEKSYGGAAAAATTPLDKLHTATDRLKVQVGQALLPIINKLAIDGVKAFAWLETEAPTIKAFVDKIVGLVGAFGGAAKGSSQVGSAISAIKAEIAAVLPIVQGLVNVFISLGPRIGPLLAQVKQLFLADFGFIVELISTAAKVITVIWRIFGSTILSTIKGALNGVITTLSGVIRIVTGIFKLFTDILKGNWKGAWQDIKSILSGALTVLKGLMQTGWALIKGAAKLAWVGIKAAVSAGMSALVAEVRKLPGQILHGIGSLDKLLVSAGIDLVEGLITGIGSSGARLASFLGSFVTEHIPGIVKKVLGIHSPSKVMAEVGQWIPKGLAVGIDAHASAVTNSVSSMLTVPSASTYAVATGSAGAAGGFGGSGSMTLNVYDSDNKLIGRMRAEAQGVLNDTAAKSRAGRR